MRNIVISVQWLIESFGMSLEDWMDTQPDSLLLDAYAILLFFVIRQHTCPGLPLYTPGVW